MPIEIRKCVVCEGEFAFKATPKSVARGFGRYCSQRCHGVATRKVRLTRLCLFCGKRYDVRDCPSVKKRDGGRFCSMACSMRFQLTGKRSRNWGGGRTVHGSGHVMIHCPGHPNANTNGKVSEHRLVMEVALGRVLDRAEKVHHINGNPADNRLENLMVLSQSEHMSLHMADWHRRRREWDWMLNG